MTECPHQVGSPEHKTAYLTSFGTETQHKASHQLSTGCQFSSGGQRHRKAQVTSAGNASCPTDTRPATSDTITLITLIASIRAAGEITEGNRGLGLKHFLIKLMNCSLTLCLSLTSQRELPARCLLSQWTRCRAGSSHLLINCSSCCSPNKGSLKSSASPQLLTAAKHPMPGMNPECFQPLLDSGARTWSFFLECSAQG